MAEEIIGLDKFPDQPEASNFKGSLAPDPHNIGGKARAMHDAGVDGPKPTPQPGTPEFFGLPSTGFTVKRSNDRFEGGWSIAKVNPNHDNPRSSLLTLQKPWPDGSGKFMTKEVPISVWESWQQDALDAPTQPVPKIVVQPTPTKPETNTREESIKKLFAPTQKVPGLEEEYGRTEFITTTPETEAAADKTVGELIRNDPEFRNILRMRVPREHLEDTDYIRKEIASNPDLRLLIANRILVRIEDEYQTMPYRVRNNHEHRKTPSYKGYQHIGSIDTRDYTALLVLSMLDGSYDPNRERYDPIEYKFIGDDGPGQHRYAAKKLISSRVRS